MVDIQVITRGNGTDALQLFGGDFARQQGDDMPSLALATDPLLIISLGYRSKAHLLIELVGGKEDVLEHRRGALVIRDLDQNAERQGVMDHRLANIEDIHPALGQHAGDGGSQTGTIFAGDIDQDDFAQGSVSSTASGAAAC